MDTVMYSLVTVLLLVTSAHLKVEGRSLEAGDKNLNPSAGSLETNASDLPVGEIIRKEVLDQQPAAADGRATAVGQQDLVGNNTWGPFSENVSKQSEVQITVSVVNLMKNTNDGAVTVYCLGYHRSVLVKYYLSVLLTPMHEHLWIMAITDGILAPDEFACSFTWKLQVIQYTMYQNVASPEINSEWAVDEKGLYCNVNSIGFTLVKPWGPVHI